MHGVDPDVHYFDMITQQKINKEGNIVFIGNCESDRVGIVEILVAMFGSKVKIFGPNWDSFRLKKLRKSGCLNPPIWDGRNCASIINSATVCLGLLSSTNQDLITRRSFEIPACGGCFLGQRTIDHLRLLREGRDALFFSDTREMIDQISLLFKSDKLVSDLKIHALKRSQELSFGYDQRIPSWLSFIFSDRNQGDELLELTGKDSLL
jgi:hypothetical protein